MKNFTLLFILLMVLFGCVPTATPPQVAAPEIYAQRFVNKCETGSWDGDSIVYTPIPDVASDYCVTYTLVNHTLPTETIGRISGTDVKISERCVTIDSIQVDDETYERIRCNFPVKSNTLNVYLTGEDLRIVVEVVINGTIYYLPPLGVEGEETS